LPIAQQLAANRPVITIMLMDQDLGGIAVQFQDFGHGVRDGHGQAAAFFKGSTPGNMNGYEWH
jgi:hypothetical protein